MIRRLITRAPSGSINRYGEPKDHGILFSLRSRMPRSTRLAHANSRMLVAPSTDSSRTHAWVSSSSRREATFVRTRSDMALPVGVASFTTSDCRSVSIRYANARSISTVPTRAHSTAPSCNGIIEPSSSLRSRRTSSSAIVSMVFFDSFPAESVRRPGLTDDDGIIRRLRFQAVRTPSKSNRSRPSGICPTGIFRLHASRQPSNPYLSGIRRHWPAVGTRKPGTLCFLSVSILPKCWRRIENVLDRAMTQASSSKT